MGRAKFQNNTDGTQTVYNDDGTQQTIGTSTNQPGSGGAQAQQNFTIPQGPSDLSGQGVAMELVDPRSGVEKDAQGDVNYYRGMASAGPSAPPPIDATRTNETRGIGMSALDMLRRRASGEETPADVQARQQTTGAVNGVYSTAASVRGGAGARAAAARGAVAGGARIQAQGDQDASALHARGIADASGQYLTASGAQRGADLTMANNQAGLDAGARDADLQRQQYYERLGLERKGMTADFMLNRSAGESAANNSAAQFAQQQHAVKTAHDDQDRATAASTVAGGLQGYGNTTQQPPQKKYGESGNWDAYDKANDTTNSDERMKEDVRPLFGKEDTDLALTPPPKATKPVSDKRASELARFGKSMVPNARAGAGMSTVDTPGNLSAQRGEVEEAPKRPGGIIRDNPYGEHKPKSVADTLYAAGPHIEQQRYGLFEPEEGGARARLGGNHGYAASRAGHAGAMFGKPVGQAIHGFEPPVVHEGARGERDRDVAMSDPRAKQEAFDLGITAGRAQATAPQGEVSGVRMMMGERPRSEPAPAETSEPDGHVRKLADTEPKGHGVRQPVAFNRDLKRAVFDKAGNDISGREPSAEQPMAPVQPSPQESGSYFGQLAARARAMTPSDPRAKEDVHGSPMASANRSMEPFSYEYKAEFTPPEQRPHEKNVGPMANKMEANPVAATAIVKDPGTGLLAIDKTKGLKLVMGGLSSLQRQVDELESRRAVNK